MSAGGVAVPTAPDGAHKVDARPENKSRRKAFGCCRYRKPYMTQYKLIVGQIGPMLF